MSVPDRENVMISEEQKACLVSRLRGIEPKPESRDSDALIDVNPLVQAIRQKDVLMQWIIENGLCGEEIAIGEVDCPLAFDLSGEKILELRLRRGDKSVKGSISIRGGKIVLHNEDSEIVCTPNREGTLTLLHGQNGTGNLFEKQMIAALQIIKGN